MSESVVVPVELLREAIQELVLGLDVMGGCDHSVGYCVCPLMRTIENLEAISAAPTPEPSEVERLHRIVEEWQTGCISSNEAMVELCSLVSVKEQTK